MIQRDKIKELELENKRLKQEISELKGRECARSKKKTYTTFEVGKICDVQPSSVIKWCKSGKVKSFSTPGGHRRIIHEDLIEFMEKYKFPIPEEILG